METCQDDHPLQYLDEVNTAMYRGESENNGNSEKALEKAFTHM